jgi:hypothetical protein
MLSEPFQSLTRVHPEVAKSVSARLAAKVVPVDPELIHLLASETLWALAIEDSFGGAVAAGYAELVGETSPESVNAYRSSIRDASRAGATQGAIMAEYLPAVLVRGDVELFGRFRLAWAAMVRKGTYVLRAPLQALNLLLKSGDAPAAAAYLELLRAAFSLDLTYEEARYFITALPRAALGLTPPRRCWQLAAVGRVLQTDRQLVEPFLTGFAKGLELLEEGGLAAFLDAALRNHERAPGLTARFLALESRSSREICAELQVRVGFRQVQDRLRRYLRARIGRGLTLRSFSALPPVYSGTIGPDRMVCSDGEAIYVPDEIGRFGRKTQNMALYAMLVRLEASLHEFGTIDFDLEKAIKHHPSVRARLETGMASWSPGHESIRTEEPDPAAVAPGDSDLKRFLARFPDGDLAADLFAVFELGRLRHCLERHYPGLVRRFYPMLRAAAFEPLARKAPVSLCDGLLLRIALAVPIEDWVHPDNATEAVLRRVTDAFEESIHVENTVEACAEWTARVYETVRAAGRHGALVFPFGWRPWPNPAADGAAAFEPAARRLKALFAAAGQTAFTSEIRRRMEANGGTLTPADIRTLLGNEAPNAVRLTELLQMADLDPATPYELPLENGPSQRYPEWDVRLGDYLQEHVHLREKVSAEDDGDFYGGVLRRHQELVRRTRAAFERMRPEGLKRLRRWRDGDEFDYRELIEAYVDRRSGEVPSDRLFVKRMKERRDVAVLLLADVSRSTANVVPGTDRSVLDIEKEAIVVLCEALSILGDGFAAAGFSGRGRQAVEYFRIKDFGEPLSRAVRRRIGALRPQRNTRMGAAVRHAARQLAAAPARVRLLIILSDGFPNDTGYKGAYAIADTRQALLELNARHIRFHALTVNLPADPKLDELYGKARHHVISDVRELPERLLRVYGALTR